MENNPTTDQMKVWSDHFGKEYTERNYMTVDEMEQLYIKLYGIGRMAMNEEFIGNFDKSIRILEVGSNIGNQLLCLQKMGIANLFGIELQHYAVEMAKEKTKGINMIQASAFDIPFKDEYFDLVFTSGVLIHISPHDLQVAMKEMYRCTKKWIWGFECFSEVPTEIIYRGKKGLLWKNNFTGLFTNYLPDLHIIKEKKYKYLENANVDTMYLMEKKK